MTPEQVGISDGWRLTLAGERTERGDETWLQGHWFPSGFGWLPKYNSYRTRRPRPVPQAEPAVAAPAAKPAAVEVVDISHKLEAPPAEAGACVPSGMELSAVPATAEAPTTAAGQAILAINSHSHDLEDGVFKTFDVNGQKVRGAKIDGRAAVMAHEFATAMGYSNPRDAVARHCKGVVKRDILTKGGPQEAVMIFSGDVNRLLVKSKLPSAQEFESLVFDTILPAIQETGGWTVPDTQLTVIPPASANDGPLALALHEIGGAMRAVVDRLMVVDTQVGHVAGRVAVVETRQAQTEARVEGRVVVVEARLAQADERLARTERGLVAIAQLQVDGERRMQSHLGVALPQLPPPAAESRVANPTGRMLEGQEYLCVEAYRQRYFPRGFKAGGLRFSSGWIGRRASAMCCERGLAMPERPRIGVEWLARCYPLGVLHAVVESIRRHPHADATLAQQPQLAAA